MRDGPIPTPPSQGDIAGGEFDASTFGARLRAIADRVDTRLGALLEHTQADDTAATPPRLTAAMKHAVLAGGKRFRPFLLIETAALFGDTRGDPELAGAAVECLHTYSLVHDDLPAMDDDDLRRGLPTVHRAFDEATAILVGDALLTLSFEILSQPELHADPGIRVELIGILARAAGRAGMVGGQQLDLAAETQAFTSSETARMQAMKTGALIAAACEMGAVLGGASDTDRGRLVAFGHVLGSIFQIADDLLDVESTPSALGKAVAKDQSRGKATLVSLHGADGARSRIDDLIAKSDSHLRPFGERARVIADAARFAGARRS